MTTPTTSSLLMSLFADAIATNGIVQVGQFQPFDMVRVYQDPANDTVMNNHSVDGMVNASTVALVVTGNTAPTGLVFEPDLALLRNASSDIKLLVESSVDFALTLTADGQSSTFAIQAGKTAVLTLGLIAGIPLVLGSHNFFDLATGEVVPPASGLFAVLTNASHNGNVLHYTSGYLIGGGAGMAAQIDNPNGRSINLVVPTVADLVNTSVALTLGPADTAQAYLHQMQTNNATANLSISPFEGSISASLQIDGGEALVIPDVQSGDILRVDFTHNEVAVIHNGTRYSDGPSSRIQPSDPLYALFVLMQNSNGVVPDLSVSEYVNILL